MQTDFTLFVWLAASAVTISLLVVPKQPAYLNPLIAFGGALTALSAVISRRSYGLHTADLKKELREAVAEIKARDRLRLETYAHLPIPVCVVDQKKRLVYTNEAAFALFDGDLRVGDQLTCRKSFCQERTCSDCVLPPALYEDVLPTARLVRQVRNGRTRYLKTAAIPLAMEVSQERHALLIVHDITDEMMLVEKARQELLEYGKAFAGLLDVRDRYTGDHSRGVARLSAAIARHLGLPADRADSIRIAALLHDIGKIGIPEAMLNKPGPLTDEEWELMKRHSDIGADAIRQLRPFSEIIPWIRHHHERIDGAGYPDGVSGSDVPLEAQIISVADHYSALTTERPYRQALDPNEALAIIRDLAGKAFSEVLVDALAAVLARSDSLRRIHEAADPYEEQRIAGA